MLEDNFLFGLVRVQQKMKKREAMAYAVRYLNEQGRSADVPICRVMEGQETAEFWAAFAGKSVGGRAQQLKEWKK